MGLFVLTICVTLTGAVGQASPEPAVGAAPNSGGLDLRRFVNDQAARLRIAKPGASTLDAGPSATGASVSRLEQRAVTDLAARCAPSSPASALASIAKVESGLAPLTIRINGPVPRVKHPRSVEEAIALAEPLIMRGRSLDLGIAQINSRNLGWLRLSVRDAFDPCRNLAAAALILDRGYAQALRIDHGDRPILQMAYSVYNSGDVHRGLTNGYVSRIEAARPVLDR